MAGALPGHDGGLAGASLAHELPAPAPVARLSACQRPADTAARRSLTASCTTRRRRWRCRSSARRRCAPRWSATSRSCRPVRGRSAAAAAAPLAAPLLKTLASAQLPRCALRSRAAAPRRRGDVAARQPAGGAAALLRRAERGAHAAVPGARCAGRAPARRPVGPRRRAALPGGAPAGGAARARAAVPPRAPHRHVCASPRARHASTHASLALRAR
jgi:hypothetical protein